MEDILLPEQIDLSKVTYGAVKVLPSQGKAIGMSHNKKLIIVQTARMRAPFNLSKWDKTEKGKDGIEKPSFKFDLLLSFDKDMDSEDNEKKKSNMNIFFNKIKAWDEKLIEDGMENSMNWLGKKIASRDVIQELYTTMLKYSRDKNTGEISDKYAPNFKVTVPYKDGKFDCQVYGPNKQEIDLSTVNLQGAYVTAIVQCTGVWVVNKKYGTTWKLLQAKVEPKSNIPKFAFREIESEKPISEETIDEDHEDNEDHPTAVEATDDDIIDDSEDELEAKPSTAGAGSSSAPASKGRKAAAKK